jgi:CarD family transcriptional regulator
VYKIGEKVVYGNTGVCVVTDITKVVSPGIDSEREYYVLKPVFDSGTIYAPINDCAVPMRKIVTKIEAEALIDMIPKLTATAFHGDAMRELEDHYKGKIRGCTCADLIELTMSIYAKREGGKFGAIDKRFMKQAEALLFGEFSIVLGIAKDEVQDYIDSRVKLASAK